MSAMGGKRTFGSYESIMPLPSGFRLLDQPPNSLADNDPLWEIVDVRFGEVTQWDLWVCLESGERSLRVTFSRPVSCRTQDEGEMVDYWGGRDQEGVAVGTLYSIDESVYKSEMQKGGVTGWSETLTHYLVAGNNVCVEALATSPPSIVMLDSQKV